MSENEHVVAIKAHADKFADMAMGLSRPVADHWCLTIKGHAEALGRELDEAGALAKSRSILLEASTGALNETMKELAEAEARAVWVPVDDEHAMEAIGTAIHTGLRKGTDAPEAHALWTAIRDSESAWSDAVAYAVVALRKYGYGTLCKPGDVPDAAGEGSEA